jgi:hypothetical protein
LDGARSDIRPNETRVEVFLINFKKIFLFFVSSKCLAALFEEVSEVHKASLCCFIFSHFQRPSTRSRTFFNIFPTPPPPLVSFASNMSSIAAAAAAAAAAVPALRTRLAIDDLLEETNPKEDRHDRSVVPSDVAKQARIVAAKLYAAAEPLLGHELAERLRSFEELRHTDACFYNGGWHRYAHLGWRPEPNIDFMCKAVRVAHELRLVQLQQLSVDRLFAMAWGLYRRANMDSSKEQAEAMASMRAMSFVDALGLRYYHAIEQPEIERYGSSFYRRLRLTTERIRRDLYWMAFFCYYGMEARLAVPPADGPELSGPQIVDLALTDGLPTEGACQSDLDQRHEWDTKKICQWRSLKVHMPEAEYGPDACFSSCAESDLAVSHLLGMDAASVTYVHASRLSEEARQEVFNLQLCYEHDIKVRQLRYKQDKADQEAESAACAQSLKQAGRKRAGSIIDPEPKHVQQHGPFSPCGGCADE